MPTVKLFTLGCKANQYDTQLIREGLLSAGLKEAGRDRAADIYVINTCTVTRHADRDSLQFIRRARKENAGARIVVTGCMAERDARVLRKAEKKLLLIGNKDKNRIPLLLGYETSAVKGITSFAGRSRAFLKIQEGCNNFCSYCKVPLVRGRSKSKDLDSIVNEAQSLVANGFREIVLCGICLGAYGRDLPGSIRLPQVIDALEHIEGLWRIRLSSIEYSDLTDALIRRITPKSKLCAHLHIPLQSGDDQVLANMLRHYRARDFLRLVERLRRSLPRIAITTDVMVGFPCEEEKNFKNTLKTVAGILPLKVHIFPYSPRPGTPAFLKYPKPLDPRVIRERFSRLKILADKAALEYQVKFLNRRAQVLIEEKCRSRPGYWQGYTDNYLRVALKSGADNRNRLVKVKLKKLSKGVILA